MVTPVQPPPFKAPIFKPKSTSVPILGLLTQKPMSGYEIRKNIDQSVGYFWQESYGQLYPELARLRKHGLIELLSHNVHDAGDTNANDTNSPHGRAKKVYRITEAGRKVLQGWLFEPPSLRPRRDELLLKLYFATDSSLLHIISHLEEARKRNARLLATYAEIDERLREGNNTVHLQFRRMTLLNGIAHRRAEMIWCEECLAMIRELIAQGQLTAPTTPEVGTPEADMSDITGIAKVPDTYTPNATVPNATVQNPATQETARQDAKAE